MSDPHIDPAQNTQAFRAFAHQQEETAASEEQPSRLPIWLAAGAVVVVVLAVAAYLLVR
jgi:type VI protein secretion system component VasF